MFKQLFSNALFLILYLSLTVSLLVGTVFAFPIWYVGISGQWHEGVVIDKQHCTDSDGNTLASVKLTVRYAGTAGTIRINQTPCETDKFAIGDHIQVRSVALDPDYILMKEDIGDGQGSVVKVLVILDVLLLSVLGIAAFSYFEPRKRSQERAKYKADTELKFAAMSDQALNRYKQDLREEIRSLFDFTLQRKMVLQLMGAGAIIVVIIEGIVSLYLMRNPFTIDGLMGALEFYLFAFVLPIAIIFLILWGIEAWDIWERYRSFKRNT